MLLLSGYTFFNEVIKAVKEQPKEDSSKGKVPHQASVAAKVAAVIGLGKALWASFFLEAEYYLLAVALKMCVAYGLALATIMSVLCSGHPHQICRSQSSQSGCPLSKLLFVKCTRSVTVAGETPLMEKFAHKVSALLRRIMRLAKRS